MDQYEMVGAVCFVRAMMGEGEVNVRGKCCVGFLESRLKGVAG